MTNDRPNFTDDQLAVVTRHYLIAALWASCDDEGPLDKTYTVQDFAPESVALAITTCEAFLKDHAELANQAFALYDLVDHSPEAMFGHDLWLTRNGHGAGFWDRGLGEVGEQLSEAARALGETYVYVGVDGKLYFGGA